MRTDDLDFDLPEDLIAQAPELRRTASRLLHYRRSDKKIDHLHFVDLPTVLHRGDLLVFNDTKVIPAKIALKKTTGGQVEGLFLSEPSKGKWRVLLKNLGDAPPGTPLAFELSSAKATVLQNLGAGEFLLAVDSPDRAPDLLEKIGRMPLPPYIKRGKIFDPRDEIDRDRYQTIYAKTPGAIAAPTAGLHFSPQLFEELDLLGIERTNLTLHVGPGTFKPIETPDLKDHPMHAEAYEIPDRAAIALNRAKAENRRIIAVGTTTARVLESQPAHEPFRPISAETNLLIYPRYRWRHLSGLITNFHLPRSTLIALVAALIGLEEQRRIYADAIARKYRFFSYGDAMFID
jgi:S-adenosylmethionine:tRNA ribosyltransferase-isomerase